MKRKYSNAIKQVARQHGVSEESVYAEMQTAINISFNNLDPAIQEYWQKLVPDGEKPTPEKLLELLAGEIESTVKNNQ